MTIMHSNGSDAETLTLATSLAAYVAKFSRDGDLLWATKIDGISAEADSD
jgi:hypothetical protein